MLAATIFDVDGVLLASPQEPAWRQTLIGFADPTEEVQCGHDRRAG
jgi:beta-phosphoglucomutase-like phosphatase (HAD superfamily)